MRKKITFPFAIAGLLVYTALYAGTLRETFEKTYKLESGGEFFLRNSNGSIDIQAWDRDEVYVEARKEVRAYDRELAEELMSRIRIEVKSRDDYLEIDTRIPKNKGGWRSFFGDNVNVSVSYRVKVPKKLRLEVSTVNGAVDVYEVGGELRLKSTNGHIKVKEADGAVDAKTTNGGIEVELLDFAEDTDMSLRTTNGAIRATFPEGFHADLDASTTNGSVHTDFPIEVRGELSRRKLRGSINGGGGRLEMHTTNGSIRIRER